MTDKVTSMFLPQSLLDAAAPPVAQDAASQARNAFLFNLLSGDIGRAYNQAQSQGYGTISNAQQLAQQQAALLKAQRDLEAQKNQLLAIKDYTRTLPGEGTSDYRDPRAQFGPGGVGPGYIPPRQEIDVEGLLTDSRYLAANPNDTAALKTAAEMRLARQQRETYDALAARYRREDGTVDAVRMAQDPAYIALLGNDTGKLKNVEELRATGTYQALADKYKRPDGTVDAVKLSQDPAYIALLGNDAGKLKSVNDLRLGNIDRETAARLATKHVNADGTINFAKLARDPEYVAQFGGDVAKAKQAADLAAEEDKRAKLEGLTNSTPLLGVPGVPSAAAQADATKKSYNDRINALNNAGLFEEANKLTQQVEKLFPEEKFGQSIQFGTINGKRGGFVLGDRGTMKRIDGVQQAPSADTLFNAGKGTIRESENGLVRINEFTGVATPVIGKDGKQVQGTSVGKVIETDGGVYRINGNTATAITGPNGMPLPGKVNAGTEDERKAAGFYQRMVEAESGMQKPLLGKDGKPVLDKDGKPVTLERLSGTPQVSSEMVRTTLPDFLGAQALGNMLDTKTRQQYRQFQENWVRANLRAESGAAIGVDEMTKEIKTYFPQIGDSQAVIEQKREARRVTANAMRQRAGRGLQTNATSNAAPTELFQNQPQNRSTLGNIYENYGLTPPARQ